jgi:3-hydroxybutyryl-CoA dehydratase
MNNNSLFQGYQVGQTAFFEKKILEEHIIQFATVTEDNNPIHLDEEFAKKSIFKTRVSHGMLTASFFSTIFGTKFPGNGCIYLEQNLRFTNPVFLDDKVVATVTLTEIEPKSRILTFDTNCHVRDKLVVTGSAKILILKEPA